MKTTLIVIENEDDHAQAKSLVEKLMASNTREDRARMAAQARLIEAYEISRWPRARPALPDLLHYLMEQHDLSPTLFRCSERQAVSARYSQENAN